MIKSYKDYIYYLSEDKKALGLKVTFLTLFYSDIWKFYVLLRRLEYLINCDRNKLYILYTKIRFKQVSQKLGFSVGINSIGPGLCIGHYGTIVINSNTKIGKNCRINVCVNIGSVYGKKGLPIIGDNVYIGPGVKIYGPVIIGDNTSIGANAVVNKSFTQGNCTIAGVPAKIVSNNNYKKHKDNEESRN